MTNNLFFTITIKEEETQFNSREHNFTILQSKERTETKSNCLWWYEFDNNLDSELKWVSWNHNRNATNYWEYLLIKIKDNLYSGFINKSKTQEDIYYCDCKPLPPKQE